ncbi:MAG: UDP-N-acetylmuramoyl-L-alanine--D-glutamate ligase [Deltaproteobacteria bacterium]|nr:UDP-N-acetylmuramoyl-L-alanine--D-glutamate ligase [Deltaproteobacteria bacterium]
MRPVDKMVHELAGRKVLVVGLARSGRAVARLLARRGCRVTGTDRRDDLDGLAELAAEGVRFELGGDRLDQVDQAEIVVLSPGVPLASPLASAAVERGAVVIGELELASRLAGLPLLAITGTNGKSTTTALCAHLLEACGRRAFLGGNIGRPLSEVLLEEERPDWAVVEVSSFQLEHLSGPDGLVPEVAIWLNLSPDHLDRHGGLEPYAAIKRRLFEGQSREQTGVFFADDPQVAAATEGLACRKRGFGRRESALGPGDVRIDGRRLEVLGEGLVLRLETASLRGDHNAENAAAAVAAVLACGPCDAAAVQSGLDSFQGLAHRIQVIRELDGVQYIDDSKGTNPEATAKSLTSFDSPVVLIAGGRGKGTGYRAMRQAVSERVRELILLGEDAGRLAGDLDGCTGIHRVQTMEEAVGKARQLARPGDVVLLSPACASFDMFVDYAHRGEVFAELVRRLEGE